MDFNQVMISNLMILLKKENQKFTEDLFRHMVLNSIRKINKKFRDEYKQLIICCDSQRSWRREVFPFYKANRKRDRDESDIDWNTIYASMHKVVDEIKNNFNYKVILIDRCEADDIIGTICYEKKDEKIIIVSGDKDFIQLHKLGNNIKQYDNVNDRFIKESDPTQYLLEHILRGDRGDGVPNARSEDNVFVMSIRQKPITQSMIDKFIFNDPDTVEMMKGYERNKKLIDLINTPDELKTIILDELNEMPSGMPKNIISYFIQHDLRNLTNDLSDFGVRK